MMTSKFDSKLVIKNLTNDDDYKFDKKHEDLFNGLAKLRQQQREDKFQDWLITENSHGFVVKNILNKMIREITDVLKQDGYLIKDQKAFRDYLASYIYRNC